MLEIEAKVGIKPAEKKQLQQKLLTLTKLAESCVSKDYYFGNMKSHIRIRDKKNKTYLTLKSKKRQQKIETNKEIEFNIKSKSSFEKWIKKADLKLLTTKEKESEIYIYKNFRIELNKVKNIGEFIEIERLESNSNKKRKTQKELIKLFQQLGIDPKRFDHKYYLEHLKEKGLIKLNNND